MKVHQSRPKTVRSHPRRRLIAVLVSGILAAAVLTACGGANTSADTLTVAIGGDYPTNFEPNSQCRSPAFQLAYEPLMRVSMTGEYVPAIAESWAYSAGNTVFTMEIRNGIKFADGTDVTAKSVVDTLNYYKSVPGINDSYTKPWTVELQGQDAVRISYKEPFIGIEAILADGGNCNNGGIISEAGLREPDKMKTEMFGAGPYLYVADESEPGDHYTFEPNPNYYDKTRQHWQKIVLRVIADPNTALNALATNQVQVNLTGGTSLMEQAKSQGFDTTVAVSYGSILMLWDRGGELTRPLGDVRVRRAMALALNREEIAQAMGSGVTPQDQFTLTGFTGYDSELPSKYTFDVDEAKRLMAEAGYADGFSLTVATMNEDIAVNTPVSAAAGQLAQIGITIDLQTLPLSTWITDAAAKKYPASAVSYGLYGVLPDDAHRLYELPFSSLWNPFVSVDPDIDQAYQSLVTSSDATFDENAHQFNEAMTAKVWYVPIVTIPQYVYSKGIDIGTADPTGSFAVADWKPKN